jgi:hypothetical protein
MAYAQTATVQSPNKSLLSDGFRVIERLDDIHGRIVKIGDMLHGSEPREAAAAAANPAATTNARNQLDRTHSLLCDVENELSRIEGRL